MNWIAVISLLSVFLLVVWLTSLIARVAGAGRSGLGWVFLAVVVSVLAFGVMYLFVNISDFQWLGWLIFAVISVLVFALVLDAGLLGGLIVGLGYTLMVAIAFIVAIFIGITNVGELTSTIEPREDAAPSDLQELVPQAEPVETAPAEAPTKVVETTPPEAEEPPDEIIGYSVDGPLQEYSFDEAPNSAPPMDSDYDYRTTETEKAGDYIGYRVRVVRKDGVELEGVLVGLDDKQLDLRHRESGGYAILPVGRAGITLFEVYR
jgi:hypothetical protein